MEIANSVSAFQSYRNFSDVIAERTKQASENSEPIKSENKLSDCTPSSFYKQHSVNNRP